MKIINYEVHRTVQYGKINVETEKGNIEILFTKDSTGLDNEYNFNNDKEVQEKFTDEELDQLDDLITNKLSQ